MVAALTTIVLENLLPDENFKKQMGQGYTWSPDDLNSVSGVLVVATLCLHCAHYMSL